MTIINKKGPIIVGMGDVAILLVSLWCTLFVRYYAIPSQALFDSHLIPFSIIFIYSVVVFYIAGLYGRQTFFLNSKTPSAILQSQIVNGLFAVVLFYFSPSFIVSPKTTLLIYLIISIVLLLLWRLSIFPLFSLKRKYKTIIIGRNHELVEMCEELTKSSRASIECIASLDLDKATPADIRAMLVAKVNEGSVSYVVIDLNDEKVQQILPDLYSTIFSNIRYINFHTLYEELFDKIPLSCLRYSWILEHMSSSSTRVYDIVKRAIDITLSFFVAIIFAISFPFVWLLIKWDDKGPAFIGQGRVGKNNKTIHIYKYRSMTGSDKGVWLSKGDSRVTRIGKILRKSRIDELPQVLSVLKGDMSFIGPRPDILALGEALAKQIPYYTVRTLLKPGLSGWAQVNQELPPQSLEETKIRLSYDLYYIKNRSLGLDIKIALRTIRTLVSRVGM
jgi:exopolysaccharide biosynthesis polyprenyl glycosylphosphotransferase